MNAVVYPILPVPKPRMTRRDRWRKRPCVLRYWAFRDEIRLRGVTLPERYHVTFVLPMPRSWSSSKRAALCGRPHQVPPDKDNLEKALLDAVYGSDAHVWDGRVSKVWGEIGEIRIEALTETGGA